MTDTKTYKAKQLADLTGVTVRTLHHYDSIGLLPARRGPNGYREYGEADLERLREVLLWRGLGTPLAAIARYVHATGELRREALETQRTLLVAQARVVGDQLEALEQMEVQERWGDTEAYRVSQRRAASRTPEQWRQIREEGRRLEVDMAALMQRGHTPTATEALELAEQMRLHIDRWFYPCSHAMHGQLAEMYMTDGRFRDHYEALSPGLAGFVAAAIVENQRSNR